MNTKNYEIAFRLSGLVSPSMRASFNQAQKQMTKLEEKSIRFNANLKKSAVGALKMTSAVSALTQALGGLTALSAPVVAGIGAMGASFASAGVGAVAYGAVAVSALKKIFEASEEVKKIQDKIDNADSVKERSKAQAELAKLYASMNEEQSKALSKLQEFKKFWGKFVENFEKPIFQGFATSLSIAEKVLKYLEPTIGKVSLATNDFLESVLKGFDSKRAGAVFDWLGETAASSLSSLLSTTKNLTSGLFGLFQSFTPLMTSFESGMVRATASFAEWANNLTNSDGFKGFIEYAKTNTPAFFELVGNVGGALGGLIKAVSPLGPPVVGMLNSIFSGVRNAFNGLDGLKNMLNGNFIKGREIFLDVGFDHGQIDFFRDRLIKTKEYAQTMFAGKEMLFGDFSKGREILLNIGFDHKKIDSFRERIITIRQYLSDVGSRFVELGSKAMPVLAKIGDIASNVFSGIYQFWVANGPQIASFATGIFSLVGSAIGGALNVVRSLLAVVQPMIPIIVSSVTDFASKILSFWQTDGAQILKAVQNIFGGIVKVIQFLAPIILPVLKMLWSTISGLINGALNVIMGAVRLFTGIFTGDFAKMWQGVKQIFFGAIEFVWNYLNLMFVGRILGGIKALGLGLIKNAGAMWTAVKTLFANGTASAQGFVSRMGSRIVTSVVNFVKNVVTFYRNYWVTVYTLFKNGVTTIVLQASLLAARVGASIRNMGIIATTLVRNMVSGIASRFAFMRDKAVSIATNMKNAMAKRFEDIVVMARALPGKIGQGIKDMAGKAVDGAAAVGNSLLTKIGNSINGVIGGLNWVGAKLGIEATIPTWAVPQYANGTKGHPGGLAILGDGRGSNAGPEMYRTPNGRLGLSPAQDTLMNLPKGTEVLSATVTRAILANQAPRYAFGTFAGKVTDAFNTGMSWVGDKAGQAKEMAFDVFSYLSNPTQLLATMLEKFGVEVPKISGALGNIAVGAFSNVKDHALSYIKGLVPKMSESLGASFSGSGSGMAKSAISQALAMLNKPLSLLGPLMTIAQKESGFDPNAINDWDINAQRGDPSVGLFQIINSTFQRWKMPGFNNRRNPLDSALAAIRYMDGRYGGIMNHPGIINMMRGGGYLPYANGGIITRPHMGLVGEAGPEAIIPLSDDKRGVATGLLRRVASVFGMEVGTKRGGMRGIVDYVSDKANASSTSSQQSVQFVYSPVIHFSGDVSRNEMDEALKMSYEDFTHMMDRFMRDRQRKAY